ncbi:GNAT family protein [Oerskovia sp. M15]
MGSLVNPVSKWLLLRHAFESWDVHRVGFRVDARNSRSLAAMRRLGAYEEGVMRGHRAAPDGTRADSVCFSILAHEWAGVELGLLARITSPGSSRSSDRSRCPTPGRPSRHRSSRRSRPSWTGASSTGRRRRALTRSPVHSAARDP